MPISPYLDGGLGFRQMVRRLGPGGQVWGDATTARLGAGSEILGDFVHIPVVSSRRQTSCRKGFRLEMRSNVCLPTTLN